MSLIEGVDDEFRRINHILNNRAVEHVHAAVSSYSDAMAILLATAGGESRELLEAADTIGDSIRSLGEVMGMLESYPDIINPYLARLGMGSISNLHNPRVPVLPSSRSVKPAEYLTSRKTLPGLAEIAQDRSRNNHIAIDRRSEFGRQLGRDYATEQEALEQLDIFLDMASTTVKDPKLQQQAESIRHSLNFVTEEALNEACDDIAQDWSAYLQQNPEAQILIPPGISELEFERRLPKDGVLKPKSDHVVLNNILERLDLDELRGRLVAHVDELTAAPENTRVIFVDDWIVSGQQMSETLTKFVEENPNSPYINCLEINLVIASQKTLQSGFVPPQHSFIAGSLHTFEQTIPVKAHYVAKERFHPDMPAALIRIPAHITGAHSLSDWGFGKPINDMCEQIDNQRREETGLAVMHPTQPPALAQRTIIPAPPSRDGYPYVTWFRRRRKKS